MNDYKKIFTRDQSLIIIESWYLAHEKGVEIWHKGGRLDIWPIIFYMLDGAEETWHSTEQYEWISGTIQKEIKKDNSFVANAIIKYNAELAVVKKYWTKEKLETVGELEEFIRHIHLAAPYFPVWYYAATDDRTPKKIRERAMLTRDQDVFYDKCDITIRNTLRHIYPELAGFETVIMREEIKNPPSIDELSSRKEKFVFVPGRVAKCVDISVFLTEHPGINFIDDVSLSNQNVTKIEGQVAFKGSAIGEVKIIRRLDQMDKVNEGDILVSPMTTPNFLSAMKKAAAFITDEGGITCHAAIVARELKKPCVIGTKVATKVLKDGDMVEVDAHKGTVKIIK